MATREIIGTHGRPFCKCFLHVLSTTTAFGPLEDRQGSNSVSNLSDILPTQRRHPWRFNKRYCLEAGLWIFIGLDGSTCWEKVNFRYANSNNNALRLTRIHSMKETFLSLKARNFVIIRWPKDRYLSIMLLKKVKKKSPWTIEVHPIDV